MSALSLYQDALRSLPPSGGGGCHPRLPGVAKLGRGAGVAPEQVFADLRAAVHGTRHVPDHEIEQAIRKAWNTDFKAVRQPRFTATIRGDDARQRIIRAGEGATAEDLRRASPIPIDWPPAEDGWRLLDHLYAPGEHLFIGDDTTPGEIGVSIRTALAWSQLLKWMRITSHPKIIPNPLTGRLGKTKDGRPSYRADDCVAAHRFVVCEFDGIPLVDQFAFWYGAKLPVSAIIHSGGKSLHAWVRVDCKSAVEWERDIECRLFPSILEPLGMDRSCKNEGRLSRMPGHVRAETGVQQRLLYLAPQGRAVND